jgi:hypothetical protein
MLAQRVREPHETAFGSGVNPQISRGIRQEKRSQESEELLMPLATKITQALRGALGEEVRFKRR